MTTEIQKNQIVTDRWPVAHALLLAFLLGLALWPLGAGDFLPLHDAAQIEHQASVIYDWNVNLHLHSVFAKAPFPSPNWLGIGLLTALAPLVGVHVGLKVLVGLAGIGVIAASWQLLRHAGHSRWLLIGVLPFIWHHDVFVGHLASIVGLPLLLAVFAVHQPHTQSLSPVRALVLAALMCVLSLANLLYWLVALIALPVLGTAMVALRGQGSSAWQRILREPATVLANVVPCLPSLALVGLWFQRVAMPEGGLSALAVEWALPMDALKTAFGHMFDVFAPRGATLDSVADLLFNRPGDVITALWLTGALLWLVAAVRHRRQWLADVRVYEPAYAGDVRESGTWYLTWAMGIVVVAYFAMPAHILRPVWVHGWSPRLVEVALILGILALPLSPSQPAPRARIHAWAGSVAMLVAATWMPLAALRSVVLIQPEISHLREAMATVPQGKSVLVLRPNPQSHWMQMHLYHALGQYFAAERGSAVANVFLDPALQPVEVKTGMVRPAPPGDDHEAFTWHDHGRFYDYIAVFRDPFGPEPRYEALLRTWPTVYQRGRWQVFHNVHPDAWPPPRTTQAGKPTQPDMQLTEDLLALWGGWLGLDWPIRYEPDGPVLRREGSLRRRLGWPARGEAGPGDEAVRNPDDPTPTDVPLPQAVSPSAAGLRLHLPTLPPKLQLGQPRGPASPRPRLR